MASWLKNRANAWYQASLLLKLIHLRGSCLLMLSGKKPSCRGLIPLHTNIDALHVCTNTEKAPAGSISFSIHYMEHEKSPDSFISVSFLIHHTDAEKSPDGFIPLPIYLPLPRCTGSS